MFFVIISSDILLDSATLKLISQSTFLIFYSLILWFFRNPKRKNLIDDKLILSPADGKIVNIKQVREMTIYANKTSYEKNLKFILINNAEYLNLSSVNAKLIIFSVLSMKTIDIYS